MPPIVPKHAGPTDDTDAARDAVLQDLLTGLVAEEVGRAPHLRVSYELATSAGVVAELDAGSEHYSASTMKLPLVLAAYRLRDQGTLDLDSTVTVHNNFTSRTGQTFSIDPEEDSDEEVWKALGTPVPLSWLCRRSIIRSSNLATNLVFEAVGVQPIAQVIADCGADGVQVVRAIEDYAAQREGISNLVTVAGLNRILLTLADGTAAAPGTCDEVLAVLADNQIATDIRPGLPEGTWVAHKNGWVSDAVLDAALVRPAGADDRAGEFALSIAVSGTWPNDRSHALVQRMASAVWEHRD